MAKLAHPDRELLPVRAFARRAGVSERTVWYDIQARRLKPAPGRPTRVPRSALATYRAGVPFTREQRLRQWLLTVREVSYLTGLSPRTVRRQIRDGSYVIVPVSARRLLIDATRTLLRESDGTEPTMAEILAESLPALQRVLHKDKLRTQRQEFIADAVRDLARRAMMGTTSPFLTVPELAQLSRKSCRTVYYDVEQGALPALKFTESRLMRIAWSDAITYAPDATDAIITSVVGGLFRDADVTLHAEIARGFAAWWRTSKRSTLKNLCKMVTTAR